MPTALIIGASRGIGREFVRQLLHQRWKVYATARSDAAMDELRSAGAQSLRLDVARADSIATLEWQLDGEKIDLALYAAGVYAGGGADTAPAAAEFDRVMHTNVLGAMQLIPSAAPLVAAAGGKFVFLSSGMGSIQDAESSHGWVYRVSKSALNMAVKSASFDYPGAALVAMCPGWVKTELGGKNAPLTVEQSVSGMLDVIATLGPADTGSYRNYLGEHLVW